jgi:hypothetical protein
LNLSHPSTLPARGSGQFVTHRHSEETKPNSP